MTTLQMTRQIEITIPDILYQWLSHESERRSQDMSAVVRTALEYYVQQFDLIQTRTWELCGAYTVAEPEPVYIVGSDETGSPITNYAENVDVVLYK